jgi:hypothetical protein
VLSIQKLVVPPDASDAEPKAIHDD